MRPPACVLPYDKFQVPGSRFKVCDVYWPGVLSTASTLNFELATLNLSDEVGDNPARDDAALGPLVQEALDGPSPALGVVERELVDPHRDEAVGQLRVHVAGELHGVGERVAPVVERVAYGLVQVCGDAADGIGAEFAADTMSVHRQRQVCPLLPPLSEVYDLAQPELLVEELPLVYEQPRVGLAPLDGLDDAVEGDDL